MNAVTAPSDSLRTTTLEFGPFPKPLSDDHARLLAFAAAKAIGHGYTVMKAETETSVKVVAVQSVPRTQPFTRVRELVPGAVVTALVGEATAQEPSR